jgi:hypothetical protein
MNEQFLSEPIGLKTAQEVEMQPDDFAELGRRGYKFLQSLGGGYQGNVWRVSKPDGTEKALKFPGVNDQQFDRHWSEVKDECLVGNVIKSEIKKNHPDEPEAAEIILDYRRIEGVRAIEMSILEGKNISGFKDGESKPKLDLKGVLQLATDLVPVFEALESNRTISDQQQVMADFRETSNVFLKKDDNDNYRLSAVIDFGAILNADKSMPMMTCDYDKHIASDRYHLPKMVNLMAILVGSRDLIKENDLNLDQQGFLKSDNLSPVLKYLMTRAVHLDPKARFEDARQFRDEVIQLTKDRQENIRDLKRGLLVGVKDINQWLLIGDKQAANEKLWQCKRLAAVLGEAGEEFRMNNVDYIGVVDGINSIEELEAKILIQRGDYTGAREKYKQAKKWVGGIDLERRLSILSNLIEEPNLRTQLGFDGQEASLLAPDLVSFVLGQSQDWLDEHGFKALAEEKRLLAIIDAVDKGDQLRTIEEIKVLENALKEHPYGEAIISGSGFLEKKAIWQKAIFEQQANDAIESVKSRLSAENAGMVTVLLQQGGVDLNLLTKPEGMGAEEWGQLVGGLQKLKVKQLAGKGLETIETETLNPDEINTSSELSGLYREIEAVGVPKRFILQIMKGILVDKQLREEMKNDSGMKWLGAGQVGEARMKLGERMKVVLGGLLDQLGGITDYELRRLASTQAFNLLSAAGSIVDLTAVETYLAKTYKLDTKTILERGFAGKLAKMINSSG